MTDKKDKSPKIVLELNHSDVNTIISALSKRPFDEVFQLIGEIHSQSQNQVSNNLSTK